MIEAGSGIATWSELTLPEPERAEVRIAQINHLAALEPEGRYHVLILGHSRRAEGTDLDVCAWRQRFHDRSDGIRWAHVKIVLCAVIGFHDQMGPGQGIPGGVLTRMGFDRCDFA